MKIGYKTLVIKHRLLVSTVILLRPKLADPKIPALKNCLWSYNEKKYSYLLLMHLLWSSETGVTSVTTHSAWLWHIFIILLQFENNIYYFCLPRNTLHTIIHSNNYICLHFFFQSALHYKCAVLLWCTNINNVPMTL